MLKSTLSRFAVKLVVFLILIFTASCLTLRTVPTSNIAELQPRRKYLKIHSEDSLWLIDQYKVKDKILTGRILRNTQTIPVLRIADVYIPSSQYVNISDGLLSIPLENIGKVDYKFIDAFMAISFVSLTIILLFYFPLMFS
jgi:hypothetical protein